MKKIYCIVLAGASFLFQSVQSQTVETVVGWTTWFNFVDNTADQGITANKSITVLTATGGAGPAVFSDVDGNGTSQRAYALGWDNGALTKAWQFQFSTTKYATLNYSCKMSGTNNFFNFLGPRDFKLQYSTNGGTWVDVSGGTLVAGNGYNTFNSLTNLALPAGCENQPVLYLRMLMTSNTAVNGGTVNGGQSHIDDILVKGTSIPEAPTNILLSGSSIYINTKGGSAPSGSSVGALSSVDFNLGNTFSYSLVAGAGNTHNNLFSITGTSLSTTASLVAGIYTIRVRSTDNSSLFFEKILTIKVVEPDPVTDGARQRVSFMGPNGNTSFITAVPPNICYNSTNNEYLSVWQADDNTPPLGDNKLEIFGQRFNANTGLASGARIRISFMGPDGNTTLRGLNPSVAYNATNNEYFVVWQGDLNTSPLVPGEDEVWGQRIDATTGALLGSRIRISTMGPDGSALYDAQNPDVSWNAVNNTYLIVWRADDNTAALIDNEYEVYGQIITNTGGFSGSRVRISAMGPDGNINYAAFTPTVTYDATDDRYLVVWRGDDNTAPLVDNEYEVFGQLINNTGSLFGSRIRISFMGPNANTVYAITTPDVAWNSTKNEFFAVWSGDDNTPPLVDNENEIFGQVITNAGVLSGSRVRLSDMGPDGATTFAASFPKIAYYAALDEYWVVWQGDDDYTSVDNESEIFLQRVNSSGAEVGDNDIRISYMGTMNSILFSAQQPAIAYNNTNKKAFVVWQGDDNTSPLVDNEFEVFGQSLFVAAVLPVSWISFTAQIEGKQAVLLNWQTAAEWNTKEFTIQRSSTATTWSNIGTKEASGNSPYNKEYDFTDTKPLAGKNYYRLLQTDQDGLSSFSKVVLIDYTEQPGLAVYPNPTVLYLTIQLPDPGKSTIKLFDNAGRLLRQEQSTGRNLVIDLKGIVPGIYHLQILQNGSIYNRKFVKI